MTKCVYILCIFLTDFIQIIIQGTFIIIVFNKKTNIHRLFIFGFINSLALLIPTLMGLHHSMLIRLLLYLIVMTLTVKFVLSTNFFTALIGTGITFIISILIEYLCLVIVNLSFPSRFDIVMQEMPYAFEIIMRSAASLLGLIALGIVYSAKMKVTTTENISMKKMFGLLINFIIIILIIISNILLVSKSFDKIGLSSLIFYIIILFVLIAVSAYNVKKYTEHNIQKQTIQQQEQYINALKDAVDGLRGFKHDYNNEINVISGYVALEDFEGFKKYFKQIQNNCWTINNTFPINTYLKNDPAIYGLFLSKVSLAELKDISFNINFNTEFVTKKMKRVELYKIIGILLDNAFEAAEDTEGRYVEVFTKKLSRAGEEGILIEISNSTNDFIDIEKIYTKGFSSKKDHTGFGLWEVKKLISKYKEVQMNTYFNNNIFTQQLKIY